MRVESKVHAAFLGFLGQPFEAFHYLVLQEMLGNPHQTLGGQPDVLDTGNVHERRNKRLHLGDGQVRNIAAGNHDVANGWCFPEIAEHLIVAILLRNLKPQLDHLRNIIADQWRAFPPALLWDSGGSVPRPPTCPIRASYRGWTWDGWASQDCDLQRPATCSGEPGRSKGLSHPWC